MQTCITTVSSTESIENVVAVIERDGGVIVEDFLSEPVLQGLANDLEKILNATPYGEDEKFAGKKTRRAANLFARTSRAVDIALNPVFKGAAEAILRKPASFWIGEERVTMTPEVRIGVTQAIQIAPGQGAQPLHRDDGVFFWRHPQYGREARVQVMVAVNDFTAENGGTLVIPGSHKWDDERRPLVSEAIPAVMNAGSALIWIGSLYHAGGENVTGKARTGVTMAYDLANVRQEENMYLSIPQAKVKELPDEIQRLLGWSAGANLMGWVEIDGQMVDPHVLLQEKNGISRGALSPL